jgi:predicted transcriptional regulator
MGITKTNLFTQDQNDFAIEAKAFAHPARIAIIEHLLNSESCINSDLVEELGLAQSTISQHLNDLKQVGIIKGDISGSRMCYCIDPERWKEIQERFENLFKRIPPTDGSCC